MRLNIGDMLDLPPKKMGPIFEKFHPAMSKPTSGGQSVVVYARVLELHVDRPQTDASLTFIRHQSRILAFMFQKEVE